MGAGRRKRTFLRQYPGGGSLGTILSKGSGGKK